MTHQAPPSPALAGSDAGRRVAQLRELLLLVADMAGEPPKTGPRDAALDEAARISAAYEAATPIVQRRFDALATEMAAWAASGVEALLSPLTSGPPRAAAARLADELDQALRRLGALVGL